MSGEEEENAAELKIPDGNYFQILFFPCLDFALDFVFCGHKDEIEIRKSSLISIQPVKLLCY